jgi:hypothetical protein
MLKNSTFSRAERYSSMFNELKAQLAHTVNFQDEVTFQHELEKTTQLKEIYALMGVYNFSSKMAIQAAAAILLESSYYSCRQEKGATTGETIRKLFNDTIRMLLSELHTWDDDEAAFLGSYVELARAALGMHDYPGCRRYLRDAVMLTANVSPGVVMVLAANAIKLWEDQTNDQR